jgi:hypothetical protein
VSIEAWVTIAVLVGIAFFSGLLGWMFRVDRGITKVNTTLEGIANSIIRNDKEHEVLWSAHRDDVKELGILENRITAVEAINPPHPSHRPIRKT